jgi:hypothetical protein
MAALYYGMYVSQDIVRKTVGNNEILLGVNCEDALKALSFKYYSWNIDNHKLESYCQWIKNGIRTDNPVIFTTKIKGMSDPDYDHIMLAAGFSAENGAVYHNSDTLIYNDCFENDHLYQTFGQFKSNKQYYYLQPYWHYGTVVTGIEDDEKVCLPVHISIDRWNEPNITQGKSPVILHAQVRIDSLSTGKSYILLRYDNYKKVPSIDFSAASADYSVPFIAADTIMTLPDSFYSNSIVVYRCIERDPQRYQITVKTDPEGLTFSIDDTTYNSNRTFTWDENSNHLFSVNSPQTENEDTQFIYTSWSNGQSRSHSYTVPGSNDTVTVYFQTLYHLTVISNHGFPSGENWYDSGSTAGFSVTSPDSQGTTQYVFINWTGDFTGSEDSDSILMNGPKTITANWITQFYLFTNVNPSTSGYMTPVPPGMWCDTGYAVVCTAIPDTDSVYIFLDWSGNLAGNENPANIIMTCSKSITANFIIGDKNPPFITHCYPPDGSTMIPRNTSIEFRIIDPESGYGIDKTSIHFSIDDSLFISNGIPEPNHSTSIDTCQNGFSIHINPVSVLEPLSYVTVHVQCTDQASPANRLDSTYTFYTSTDTVHVTTTSQISQTGSLVIDDSTGFKIDIPSNAVEDSVNLRIGIVEQAPAFSDTIFQTGVCYYLDPGGFQFSDSAIIYIPFTQINPDNSSMIDPIDLQINFFSTRKGEWVKLESINIYDNNVSVSIKELGYFILSYHPNTMIEHESQLLTLPVKLYLLPNYPNPFNANTIIRYQIPVTSQVTLAVYNTIGQKIKNLIDCVQISGFYEIEWDGKNEFGETANSGLYFCILKNEGAVKVKKLIFAK